MRVIIEVYDIEGRRVKVLENRLRHPGIYTITWRGDLAGKRRIKSGVYFVIMKAGLFRESRKIVITK